MSGSQRLCPLFTGSCSSECAWHVADKGCAIAVLATEAMKPMGDTFREAAAAFGAGPRNEFPPDDDDFEEHVIDRISDMGDYWGLGFGISGVGFRKGKVTPKVGDTVRLYPKGYGQFHRGLFINGQRVFYGPPVKEGDASV